MMPADNSSIAIYNGRLTRLPVEFSVSDQAMLRRVYALKTRKARNSGLLVRGLSNRGCRINARRVGKARKM
ncbi:hypothetical protein D3C76_1325770 [compost metagenome]